MTEDIFESVYDFINTCPLVGSDMYFNFIDQDNAGTNTSLLPVSYGELIKEYADGGKLRKVSFEIRQVKPLAQNSNTLQNVEQIQLVQKFMNWIKEQDENKNYPDFGEGTTIEKMGFAKGVVMPALIAFYDNSALYGFPFEITYTERN